MATKKTREEKRTEQWVKAAMKRIAATNMLSQSECVLVKQGENMHATVQAEIENRRLDPSQVTIIKIEREQSRPL